MKHRLHLWISCLVTSMVLFNFLLPSVSPLLSSTGGAGIAYADPTTTPTDGSDAPGCEDSGYALSWIMCKVIAGLADTVDWIYGSLVQPLLQINPVDINNDSNDPSHTYAIWSNFRVYGDIFLVIALLVIVFGESIGGGMIDAYSAKKILPRLLIAAILINLSIYLIALAVDVTNVVGDGLNNLLQAPFKAQINSNDFYVLHMIKATGATGSVLTVGAIVGIAFKAQAGFDGLMYFLVIALVPALFIFLAIMATVILRRGLILLLIFLSPIAFALYCLPNTEKYFRQWWDTLFKALLVYPIIAAMFAMGNILSVVISSSTSGIAGSLATLIGLVSMLAPLFLIPYSFRIAGGLLGRFHEFATTTATKGHQAVRGDAKNPDSMRSRAQRRFAVSRNEANLTNKAFTNRLSRPQDVLSTEGRARRRSRLSSVREAGRGQLGAQAAESDPVYRQNQKNDQYLLAVADEKRALAKRDAAEATGDTMAAQGWNQAISSARATPRNAATRMKAAQDLATTGYQIDRGQAGYNQMAKMMADITGADLMVDAATGNVMGATGVNAGAYSNAMNNAQFNIRAQGGRYDMGGINAGASYDNVSGTDKGSLYELANAKPESIDAMAAPLSTTGALDNTHAVVYKELEAMKPSSKGGARDAIKKQMDILEARGIKTHMLQNSTEVGEFRENLIKPRPGVPGTSTAGWTPAEVAQEYRIKNRLLTHDEVAQKTARTYERPDPNRQT